MIVDPKVVARCRQRLAKIEETKDEGVFARMYAEDVPILLDGATDDRGGDPPSERLRSVHARVCGGDDHEHLTAREAVDCVLDRLEGDQPSVAAIETDFRRMLIQELAWHAMGECDCVTLTCRERSRQIAEELGLKARG